MTDLADLQSRSLEDSRRWFPHLHEDVKTEITHFAMGLGGEVGEVLNLVKKWHRDHATGRPFPTGSDLHRDLAEELADVQIYLAALAEILGVDLGEEVRAKADRNEDRFG